jgi:hypothetical protein
MIKNPNVWLLIFKRACFTLQKGLFQLVKSPVSQYKSTVHFVLQNVGHREIESK